MFLLLFFVLLIQFVIYWIFEPFASFLEYLLEIRFLPIIVLILQIFTYWIFEPLASFLGYFLEIRLFPIIALLGLILLFSGKTIEKN